MCLFYVCTAIDREIGTNYCFGELARWLTDKDLKKAPDPSIGHKRACEKREGKYISDRKWTLHPGERLVLILPAIYRKFSNRR